MKFEKGNVPVTTNGETISAVDAAKILGVSRGTVLNWYHKGWLPGYKLGGKTSPLKLYREGVLQFLEARKAASPVPANTTAPTNTEVEVEAETNKLAN